MTYSYIHIYTEAESQRRLEHRCKNWTVMTSLPILWNQGGWEIPFQYDLEPEIVDIYTHI